MEKSDHFLPPLTSTVFPTHTVCLFIFWEGENGRK